MSILHLLKSRSFRAVAAFLMCLMVLTACQDVAQQVVSPAAPPEALASSQAKGTTILHRAKSGELSDEEKDFGTTLVKSSAFKQHIECMNEINLAIYSTSRTRKAELTEAFKERDEKKLFQVLGYSEKDAEQFKEKRANAWKEMLSIMSKHPKVVSLILQEKDRLPLQCKSCDQRSGAANPELFVNQMASAKLEDIIIPVPGSSIAANQKGANLQSCNWYEPWNAVGFAVSAAVCVTVSAACMFGAPGLLASLAAGTWWVLPIVIAVLGTELIGGVFDACLNLGAFCLKKVECFWCNTNC